MKIGICLNHKESIGIYRSAGYNFPTIPNGNNTFLHHFKTVDGRHAVIVNQRGFTPIADDDENEVNGCSLYIADDEGESQEVIEATLNEVIENFLNN